MTDPAATLAALCSRGPWRAGRHHTVTGEHVRAVYEAIASGDSHVAGMSHAAAQKSRMLLGSAGLIEYAGTPKRWRVAGGES